MTVHAKSKAGNRIVTIDKSDVKALERARDVLIDLEIYDNEEQAHEAGVRIEALLMRTSADGVFNQGGDETEPAKEPAE